MFLKYFRQYIITTVRCMLPFTEICYIYTGNWVHFLVLLTHYSQVLSILLLIILTSDIFRKVKPNYRHNGKLRYTIYPPLNLACHIRLTILRYSSVLVTYLDNRWSDPSLFRFGGQQWRGEVIL